jgi:hypothetical protein
VRVGESALNSIRPVLRYDKIATTPGARAAPAERHSAAGPEDSKEKPQGEVGMGKEDRTAAALEIAKDFIEKKLPPLLKIHDSDNIENSFPLSHVPHKRAANRTKLWEGIEEKTGFQSRTARACRAALLFFSEWIFTEAIATGKHITYETPDAEYRPLFMPPVSSNYVDVSLPKWSHVKVKKIKGEKDWFETKLELLKLVSPMITNYADRAMIKRQIRETEYYLKPYKSGETPGAGKPQNPIFNALIFTVLSILHLSQRFNRKEAEALTAGLINEYCYWNPRISSLVWKLTQKKVSDLYDNSPLRRTVSLRMKKSD